MIKITKFSKIKFVLIFLCPLLITSSITFYTPIANSKIESNISLIPIKTNYVERESILIDNDTHFASFGFPGTGEDDNPYIIENFNITSGTGSGIRIKDTTVYFVIRDCYISHYSNGIRLNNVTSNTSIITNNICFGTGAFGIDLIATEQANVTNNIIRTDLEENYKINTGISLYYSPSSYIANNTCVDSDIHGIFADNSDSSIIHNNTCINSNYGIKIEYSNFTTISENFCSSSTYSEIDIQVSGSCLIIDNVCSDSTNPLGYQKYGMNIRFCYGSTIENNSFDLSGLTLYQLTLEGYASYTIRFNEVNGEMLGYFKHEEDLVLSYAVYGQIILINCTNAHISNQDFHDLPFEAIFVYESSDTLITHNFFRRIGRVAVKIENSPFCGLTYNDFEDSYYYGAYLKNADNATIGDNTFQRNFCSLVCEDSYAPLITLNTFEETIHTDVYVHDSNSSIITDNLYDNSGIVLYVDMNTGLDLERSDNALIEGNTFYRYEGYGIDTKFSDFSEIKFNLFQENTQYAIYLEDGEENMIHHNTFQDNNLGGDSQAYSSNSDNYWFDPLLLEGNWWSDWSGTGHYYVFADADYYPLGEPIIPPIIAEFHSQYCFLLSILLLPFVIGIYYYRKSR